MLIRTLVVRTSMNTKTRTGQYQGLNVHAALYRMVLGRDGGLDGTVFVTEICSSTDHM